MSTKQDRPNQGVLTVQELAELLRVSTQTAYAAVARGDVPGVVRVARTIRISKDAISDWLKGSRRRSRGTKPVDPRPKTGR